MNRPPQENLKRFLPCQADLHWQLARLYESPARIGALALTEKGNLIVSQHAGVAILGFV